LACGQFTFPERMHKNPHARLLFIYRGADILQGDLFFVKEG